MKILASAAVAAACLCAPVLACDATIHGQDLHRVGNTVQMKNYDVTLDGRLLTAEKAIYHEDTGVLDLQGQVHLKFGKRLRSFPGEVR